MKTKHQSVINTVIKLIKNEQTDNNYWTNSHKISHPLQVEVSNDHKFPQHLADRNIPSSLLLYLYFLAATENKIKPISPLTHVRRR